MARSATNHAGVPAMVTTAFTMTHPGALTGGSVVVYSPEDGRKIKLHSYMLAPSGTGYVELTSSGTGLFTSLTGQLNVLSASPAPFTQNGGVLGLGSCVVNEDLVVSGTSNAAGTVTYSLVP